MPRVQNKRGTSANLAAVNPVPLAGELVWDYTANAIKIGDGSTAWTSLAYVTAPPRSHTHSADAITSGTVAYARLPVGSTASTVCAGDDARLSDARTPTDGSVTTAKIADDAVTYAKIQDVSATDLLLGRSSVGSGNVEEITCTSFGRSLIDDVDAAAGRTTLGLGSLATVSPTGTANGSTFLRGDGAWATPEGGGGAFTGGTLTSAILVIPGAAATPGLAVSGDANTGIYQETSAADTLSVSAGGSEVARFAGTRHQVNRDTLFSGTTGVISGSAGVIFASGTNHFRLCGNTTSQFTVARVSSLSTTPDEDACLRVVSLNASDTRAQVQVGAFNSAGFPQYTFIADTNTGINNPASDSLSLVTAGSDRVRVDSSGRVGIGTTSPAQLLQVNGTAQITSLTDGTTTKTLADILAWNGSQPAQAGGGTAVNNVIVMTAAAYAALAAKDPNTLYFVI